MKLKCLLGFSLFGPAQAGLVDSDLGPASSRWFSSDQALQRRSYATFRNDLR